MRKFVLLAIIASLLVLPVSTVSAAPPQEGPIGLERAIAAQEAHNPHILNIPGVVGTAVSYSDNDKPVVKIFTEKPGVRGLPETLDGIPVVTQITGKIYAAKPPEKSPKPDEPDTPGGNNRNKPPQVNITSPAYGSTFNTGDMINFMATAYDKEDKNLTISWISDKDGELGTGDSISLDSLSTDTHTITASVKDSGGKTASDSITIYIITGSNDYQTTDEWPRAVPIGISTGNSKSISAGTIGCRVKDTEGNVYALSNTHVYAPYDITGQSAIGDNIMQPGRLDVPGYLDDPDLYIGTLSAYKPIDGSIFAYNTVDAAIALTTNELLDNTTPESLGGYGIPNNQPVPDGVVMLNMAVQKFGRTTKLTKGVITGLNATVMVEYSPGWYALFYEQVIVESPTAFLLPGDSGSLLVTDDDDLSCNPVGLMFAGNADGTYAVANPIGAVLSALNVTIDGK